LGGTSPSPDGVKVRGTSCSALVEKSRDASAAQWAAAAGIKISLQQCTGPARRAGMLPLSALISIPVPYHRSPQSDPASTLARHRVCHWADYCVHLQLCASLCIASIAASSARLARLCGGHSDRLSNQRLNCGTKPSHRLMQTIAIGHSSSSRCRRVPKSPSDT
jgi:hypothetical protein